MPWSWPSPRMASSRRRSRPWRSSTRSTRSSCPTSSRCGSASYVQFPNKDNIRHHVYSFSAARKFELPLYSGTPAQPVLFDKVGVVKLGCNIHDWMIGYIYVTETPYFGKSNAEGRVDMDPAAARALSGTRLASAHGRIRRRDGQACRAAGCDCRYGRMEAQAQTRVQAAAHAAARRGWISLGHPFSYPVVAAPGRSPRHSFPVVPVRDTH